jgi:hypothetical protein
VQRTYSAVSGFTAVRYETNSITDTHKIKNKSVEQQYTHTDMFGMYRKSESKYSNAVTMLQHILLAYHH